MRTLDKETKVDLIKAGDDQEEAVGMEVIEVVVSGAVEGEVEEEALVVEVGADGETRTLSKSRNMIPTGIDWSLFGNGMV
jgi:hypothetical protein